MSTFTFNDLREWISQAKKIDELIILEGADTKYEIGTIAQVAARNLGQAILFQKIKGYPSNFRVLTNMLSNIKTINLTFGLPIEYSVRDAVETLRESIFKWEKEASDFPPKVVDKGPILEHVEENKIDLHKFPVPIWHELDSGPYIGTAVAVVTRDPDTGEINAGTYRCQLHDDGSVGIMISQGHQGRIHRDKYFERGEPCPMVMVVGIDPLLFSIACSEIPPTLCEFNYIGAMRREPVPVIKGKATGLPIPANAEIAIEGFADPKATKLEGPFGEWTGYYASPRAQQPFIKPAVLYYRSDPILTGAPPAKGLFSSHILSRSVWRSAILYNELVKAGVPEVKGVWCPPAGGTRYFQIISIKQRYPGHATHAGHVAAQSRSGAYQGRYTIIVDEDIDPYDIDDVLWAMSTRSEPADFDIIKHSWSGRLDPIIRNTSDDLTTSRAIIYAVKPYAWRNEFSPVNVASEELRKEAFDKWKDKFKGRWQAI